MIKKLKYFLFLLLFGVFGFSFCNAQSYTSIQTEKMGVLTGIQGGVKYQVSGGGTLLSQYLGVSRRILAPSVGDPKVYFFWGVDHIPYSYYYYPSDHVYMQGYYDYYQICDELTGGTLNVSNCVSYKINTGTYTEALTPFFKSLTSSDYYGYSYGYYTVYVRTYYLRVCFSSSEYHNSVCFMTSDGLHDSLGLDEGISFGDINQLFIGNPPGFAYDGSEGSSDSSINNQITGDYSYYDCTWKDIIIALESEGYNNYVCYGGLDNFNLYDSTINYSPIPGTGLSINEIWGHDTSRAWDNFTDFFVFWNGLYKDDSNNYNAMRESYPAVYRTYFQLYNQYKGGALDPRTLLEYCNIKSFDNSTLNNSAGGYFKSACETVVREKQTGLRQARLDGTIYSGGVYTGDIPISVNWNGVGNMSGLETQSDGLSFIQNYFNLIKNKLPTNFDGGIVSPSGGLLGIIPNYIIVFLLAIILFKFLSK